MKLPAILPARNQMRRDNTLSRFNRRCPLWTDRQWRFDAGRAVASVWTSPASARGGLHFNDCSRRDGGGAGGSKHAGRKR